MENSLEISGKSTDEAIEKGLAQLGLSREQVDIEIIRESSRGVFGLRGEDALVRVTPRAASDGMSATPPAGDAEALRIAQETLEKLVRGMGFEAHVQTRAADDGDGFVLNIEGKDLGVLIGRRGETLHDLEFITRLLVQQQVKGMVQLSVDVENYRGRRERQLRELGLRMAERVQASQQPITLEAMPPNERRIVHIALKDHATVTTQSIGEGDHRRVMILPKK